MIKTYKSSQSLLFIQTRHKLCWWIEFLKAYLQNGSKAGGQSHTESHPGNGQCVDSGSTL